MAQTCANLKCPFIPYCKNHDNLADHATGCATFDNIIAAAKTQPHLIKPVVTLPISVEISGTFIYLKDLLPYVTKQAMENLVHIRCPNYKSLQLPDDAINCRKLIIDAIKPHENIASFLCSVLPNGARFCEFRPDNQLMYIHYSGAIFYPDDIIGKPDMPATQADAAGALTELILSCTDRSYIYATNVVKHDTIPIYSWQYVPETQLVLLARSSDTNPTDLRFTIADRVSMLPIIEQKWVKYPSDITYPSTWNADLPTDVYYQTDAATKPVPMHVSIASKTVTKTTVFYGVNPDTKEQLPYVPSDFTNQNDIFRWLTRRNAIIV